MNEPGTHKLTEALQGQETAATPGPEAGPDQDRSNTQTQAEISEQTRLAQQSRADGIEDRDARLVRVGRGQQTHG
jgi:hypothetical protein